MYKIYKYGCIVYDTHLSMYNVHKKRIYNLNNFLCFLDCNKIAFVV